MQAWFWTYQSVVNNLFVQEIVDAFMFFIIVISIDVVDNVCGNNISVFSRRGYF